MIYITHCLSLKLIQLLSYINPVAIIISIIKLSILLNFYDDDFFFAIIELRLYLFLSSIISLINLFNILSTIALDDLLLGMVANVIRLNFKIVANKKELNLLST